MSVYTSIGGKLGQDVKQRFNIQTAGDLVNISKVDLCRTYGNKQGKDKSGMFSRFLNEFLNDTRVTCFGDSGTWLYNICRGHDNEPVKERMLPKSIGYVPF